MVKIDYLATSDGQGLRRELKEGDLEYTKVEISAELEAQWQADVFRPERDALLKDTDWTQQPDVPEATRTKWQSYRQALRDLPTHSKWPNLEDSDWPTKPS